MQGSSKRWGARKSSGFYSLAAATALSFLAACFTTPVTGRTSFNPFSIENDKTLGAQSYAEVMKTSKLADSRPEHAMVQRCVDRLVAVADDPGNFDWEVHLIDEPETVNAWCMPGGKMAVYTGILPVTEDETGLAVVMAHEIGHAVARHGTESLVQQFGLSVIVELLAGKNADMWGSVATASITLPNSRDHELEADEIGLIYMARAGYDPDQAIAFWQRMAAQSSGAPPEWLSTHPSDDTRIAALKDNLKKARSIYAGKKSWKPNP
ncbi:MAG: M48 family metallopeptidase [Planctomycetes bacterium]|nr:M48 family metallopeptidase [Planctomycetota bacterium]